MCICYGCSRGASSLPYPQSVVLPPALALVCLLLGQFGGGAYLVEDEGVLERRLLEELVPVRRTARKW